MFTTVSSGLLSAGRQLALPLPLFMLLAGPAARAQAADSAAAPLADLSVYPNPAHIRATVQVPAVPGATRATVTVTDAQGTVVFEQPVSMVETGGTTQVPLLGRAPGLYRVVVQAGAQRVAKTLKVE
ncbi:T9SS type A sorting domain-containing protein [Hymenobacter sp.]|uniref:T9SS type A sorting domain-containing protein n=1 Tax=Hymenobacter sp. TaxID=1898978 RepID=UPI00286C8395|nr:T9SS type A sorting domain-containing protein [Hymenobacter sp.]